MTLQLKPKQQSVIDIINTRPEIDEIILIGPTGTGKSALTAHVFISIAEAFPHSQLFVWRKNFNTARKTIWRTYKKMMSDMNMVEDKHYKLNEGSLLIEFPNKSLITFAQADSSTDKDQNKIKGLDITANQLEESNELIEDAADMIMSRKGRANQEGQPSINIHTMNPNNGWAKNRYYDKWKKGQLPSNVMVIEFTLEDSWQSDKDINSLIRSKPKWWVERYLRNNWNYLDEDHALIKGYLWERASIFRLPEPERNEVGNIIPKFTRTKFNKVIGVDVSDGGGDACVATLIEDDIVMEQRELKIPERTYGQSSEVDSRPIGYLFAQQLIAWAESKGFTKAYAHHISIECNGVGTSMRDNMKLLGWYIDEYVATGKSRNETALNARRALEDAEIQIFQKDAYRGNEDELWREISAHDTDMVDGVEKVTKKEKIKEILGRSPDYADSFFIAVRKHSTVHGKIKDPAHNLNRIGV
tara:strand:- start:8371 stop:9786 length:1416 start_codon:yes stop_codon:yes gene_type:complete